MVITIQLKICVCVTAEYEDMCFRIPVVYGVSLVQPELIFGEVRDESHM